MLYLLFIIQSEMSREYFNWQFRYNPNDGNIATFSDSTTNRLSRGIKIGNIRPTPVGIPDEDKHPITTLLTDADFVSERLNYREVEINSCSTKCRMYFGWGKPFINTTVTCSHDLLRANLHLLSTETGQLWGKDVGPDNYALGKFQVGDRVGSSIDFDTGIILFYKNGKKFTRGFKSPLEGQYVFTIILVDINDSVRIVQPSV